ncbi:carbon-nitrogen hydrolase family protein [Caldivirga sp.]|uniref:carbon-nitrogen hydrolase family protein n=1 Tax=Caldivirga sp. TaxID=2080243 RepID=UPI003D0B981D
MLRIHLIQYASKLGDPEYNISRLREYAKRNCRGDGNDVLITPELYVSGYMSKDLLLQIAEPLDGDSISELTEIAREGKCTIVTGIAERDKDTGVVYNSAVAVGENGLVAFYRKRHLPSYGVFDESRYFGIGRGDAPVFPINGTKAGLAICYDAFYPEVSRSLMLKGAKVQLYISAAPDMSRPHFETFIRARAMENVSFVVYVNTIGQYDGLGFFGGSFIVDPLGEVVAKAKYYEEDTVVAEIDPSLVDNYRSIRPILKDYTWDDVRYLLRNYKSGFRVY